MANTSDFKNGLIIEHKNIAPWTLNKHATIVKTPQSNVTSDKDNKHRKT